MSGPHVALGRAFHEAVVSGRGKPITMNVSMPIAAVMLDLWFPPTAVKGVPLLARTASLIAHLAEEQRNQIGFLMAGVAEDAIAYEPPPRGRRSDARAGGRGPPVGGSARRRRRDLPRASSATCSSARRSTAEARRCRASPLPRPRAGWRRSPHFPSPTKQELRDTCTDEAPIGAHLCVEAGEIARIYSTSGTTGTPSYIPLTASDLENWIAGSARSYAASGIGPGERIVSTYNAGPFVAGAALASFDRLGLSHIPVGTGNTERLLRAIELLRPTGRRAHPLLRRPSDRVRRRARLDLAASSVERVLVAGEPGGGEPAFRARLEDGWGAQGHRGDGHRRHRVSLWGECEEQDGMHLGARDFVHAELIDPETGAARDLAEGAPASSCSRICATAPRRCFGSARATTSR